MGGAATLAAALLLAWQSAGPVRGAGIQRDNTNLIDLVQVQLNAPGKVTPGKKFRVLDELENQGEASSLQTVTYFYLSYDDQLDEKDLVVGGRRVPPLMPGGSHNTPTAITLPVEIPPGDFFLIALCDATKLMDERYENNNTRAVRIKVLAPSRD
jgi:hypothetical protein